MPLAREMEHEIRIPVPSEKVTLDGNLYIPGNPQGLVVFAHGSGSSRFSPRNRYVAQYLNKGSYGTLLFDLLTRPEEESDLITSNLRFDIDLLSRRLGMVTDWVQQHPDLSGFNIGYFGASTGAAAALVASVGRDKVRAVVSRGGRPDIAGDKLRGVKAPALFIVGGDDYPVIELNRKVLGMLGAEAKELQIVPHATHLFEEPGALEEVARLAADWFIRYLH